MADAITRQNETARRRADAAGRATYQHQVVDAWPACVDCATPIRHRAGGRGMHRRCGCPGVRWRCDADGWKRVPAALDAATAQQDGDGRG